MVSKPASRRGRGRPSARSGRVPGRRCFSTPSVALGPPALLLLLLVGGWVGHALEYLRVSGTSGFGEVVSRSVHAYMGPVGLALLGAGVIATVATLVSARALERRLIELRASMASRHRLPDESAPQKTPRAIAVTTLAWLMWMSQLVLYLIQENLEAQAAHLPQPGFGAISGRHALAPLVHLAVALVLAGLVCVVRARFTKLVRQIRQTIALLARRRRPLGAIAAFGAPAWSTTPAERWGKQSWCRPPPVPTAA